MSGFWFVLVKARIQHGRQLDLVIFTAMNVKQKQCSAVYQYRYRYPGIRRITITLTQPSFSLSNSMPCPAASMGLCLWWWWWWWSRETSKSRNLPTTVRHVTASKGLRAKNGNDDRGLSLSPFG